MTSDGGSNDIVSDRNTGGTATNGIADNGDSKKVADGAPKTKDTKNPNDDCPASPAPIPPPTSYQQTYLPQSTPQQAAGFFVYPHSQVTPEQPSPATPGYDVNSFLQQHAALGVHPALSNPFGTNQYGGLPQAPLSPTRSGGAIPPASPLFSRPSGVGVGAFEQQNQVEGSVLQRMSSVGAPPSPSITYMSPPLGSAPAASFSAMYQGYVGGISGSYGNSANGESTSQEDNTWSDRYVPRIGFLHALFRSQLTICFDTEHSNNKLTLKRRHRLNSRVRDCQCRTEQGPIVHTRLRRCCHHRC